MVRRHRLSTRLWHWVNAVLLLVMLMSGLMIFNAHPRLYWGQYGANPDPAWLEIGDAGGEGFVRVGDVRVTTTGVLGRWQDGAGITRTRAFPDWATIPSRYSLSVARRWHLTFAWVFAGGLALYGAWSLANGHFWRDLRPRPREMRPGHIWHDFRSHALLRFPRGAAARDYGILQKASYLGVLAVLLPGMIMTGLAMSPAMVAAWPWLLDLFAGRQTARSLHFVFAALLVAFFVVHVAMVLLAGPVNQVRSMVTGRYRLPGEEER